MASTTLNELDWQTPQLIEGDVPEAVRRLEKHDGPQLQVHGSANLLETLLAHGLIDEFRPWICPLMLGKGKRRFDGSTVPAGLELTTSQVSHRVTVRKREAARIAGGATSSSYWRAMAMRSSLSRSSMSSPLRWTVTVCSVPVKRNGAR